ncbi:MAG: hypothetical protein BAJALOKI1v1_2270001 [Promethearchaeota archaeon]|nr:MAG: hypothetical protein BAJALOKI1v1_2270001 [Candidatus Lokiarchaeota archaeon]
MRRHVKQPPRDSFYFTDTAPMPENVITMSLAEFEAMRLKHYINLTQKDAANKMNVSQPTFSRVLDSAHKKVTKALIEGKQIRVTGGNVRFKTGFKGYGCLECDYEWQDENASKEKKKNCPKCGSSKVYFLIKEPL